MKRLSSREATAWRLAYGPLAVVTGASDGIGRAMAQALAAPGIDLLLVARRGAVLDALAADLRDRHGVAVETVVADLAHPAGTERVLAALGDRAPGLVIAAAGFGAAGRFADARRDDLLGMIDVNCRAVTDLVRRVAPAMAERRRGVIMLMSSLVAFQGVPDAAAYAATKAYVQALAEGLRSELRPTGVRVVAVAPGPVNSGFAARAGMRMGLADPPEAVARGALASLGRRATVRPGPVSKALEASLAPLPRSIRVWMMGRVMKGMVANGDDRPRSTASGTAP